MAEGSSVTKPALKCPKCGGEMEEGPMFTGSVQRFPVTKWGKSRALSMLKGASVEEEKDLTTYRCKSCGYLENYAK